jgi:hypothetical protein
MKAKSLNKELEEIISKVVGRWYSEDRNHSIDFSHTERILSVAPVKIMSIGHRTHKTNYIIGIQEDINLLSNQSKFYFEIGRHPNKKRYLIKEITRSKMVVHQLELSAKIYNDITYVRNKQK